MELFEDLILVQDERWRCALSMQVGRPDLIGESRTAEYKIGIYPLVWNTSAKAGLIPHESREQSREKALNCAPMDEPVSHQLVGRVMAYQGYDG